jgi:ribonuclease BN (tRNA processing enzyme)
VNDRRYYPIYQTCIDLDMPIVSNAGIAGPRFPSACQDVMLFDEVCYDFPELRIVMRHGAEPWEALAVGPTTVTAVPAQHDVYEVGYVVQGAGRCVYFAGDTRLFDGIDRIAERFHTTAAVLPVDGTRITGSALHVMTPTDAVIAAGRLGAPLVLPSHAEAVFSDPFVEAALASTVSGAAAAFAKGIARALPAVRCAVPAAGELVPLPA